MRFGLWALRGYPSHYDLAFFQARQEHLLYVVGLKYPGGGRSFPTLSDGPIPESVMLESSVVFLPRLLGTDRYSRSPLGA
jgi:hypothetical protein